MPKNYNNLPPELRQDILSFVIQDHGDAVSCPLLYCEEAHPTLADYATVCREWAAVVEAKTFSSLNLFLERMDGFAKYVVGDRRRRVRNITLYVKLPAYPCEPCVERESLADKQRNNDIFTQTVRGFFDVMSSWPSEEGTGIVPGGISLTMSAFSESDLRNVPIHLWQKRRFHAGDIGEKRFADSALDFVGRDDNSGPVAGLKPVHAITSFETDLYCRRVVMAPAYGEIIAALQGLRQATLHIGKEKKLAQRKVYFSQLGKFMVLWPPTLKSFTIKGNTLSSWRDIPHESVSEGDSGQQLCGALRDFAPQLKHLVVRDLVAAREFLLPAWPADPSDRGVRLATALRFPVFTHLETVEFQYNTWQFSDEWFRDGDFNEDDQAKEWRQRICLAAARLALRMPRLRRMCVGQRPMMWAGKHRLTYTNTSPFVVSRLGPDAYDTSLSCSPQVLDAEEGAAVLAIESSFHFRPEQWVVEAWMAVARQNARKTLKVRNIKLPDVPVDGAQPAGPSPTF